MPKEKLYERVAIYQQCLECVNEFCSPWIMTIWDFYVFLPIKKFFLYLQAFWFSHILIIVMICYLETKKVIMVESNSYLASEDMYVIIQSSLWIRKISHSLKGQYNGNLEIRERTQKKVIMVES